VAFVMCIAIVLPPGESGCCSGGVS